MHLYMTSESSSVIEWLLGREDGESEICSVVCAGSGAGERVAKVSETDEV